MNIEKITLKFEGHFNSQKKMEEYLNALLQAVKSANQLNVPFHSCFLSDEDHAGNFDNKLTADTERTEL